MNRALSRRLDILAGPSDEDAVTGFVITLVCPGSPEETVFQPTGRRECELADRITHGQDFRLGIPMAVWKSATQQAQQ